MRAIRNIARLGTPSEGGGGEPAGGSINFPNLFQAEETANENEYHRFGGDDGVGLANKKIASGTDGLIYWQYAADDSHVIGLDTSNTIAGYSDYEFEIWADTPNLKWGQGGFFHGSIDLHTLVVGEYYGIRRVSGQLESVYSSDGVTWTVIHEFGSDTSADLFILFHTTDDNPIVVYGENLVDV